MNLEICRKCCGVGSALLRYSPNSNNLDLVLRLGDGRTKCAIPVHDPAIKEAYLNYKGKGKVYVGWDLFGASQIHLTRGMRLYRGCERKVGEKELRETNDFTLGRWAYDCTCPYLTEHFISDASVDSDQV